MLTIADSGERKSTCDRLFSEAIRDYEEAQAETAKPILKDHRAEVEAWEAKRSGIKDKIRHLAKESEATASMEAALRELEQHKPEPPRIPRLLYADAAPEALVYSLAKQWPSSPFFPPEAITALARSSISLPLRRLKGINTNRRVLSRGL